MGEVTVTLEALAERVERLEQYIDSQVTPRFDDVQDDHRSLSARVNEYQTRVEKQLSYANERLVAELYKLLEETNQTISAEFRQKFDKLLAEFEKSVKQEISGKKVLVTRPATREEVKSGAAIAVRQATRDELRS